MPAITRWVNHSVGRWLSVTLPGEPIHSVTVVEQLLCVARGHVGVEAVRPGLGEQERMREHGAEHRRQAQIGTEVVVRLDVVEARADVDRRRQRQVEVSVSVELAHRIVRLDAEVVLIVRRDVVARQALAAGQAEIVLTRLAGLEDRRPEGVLRGHAIVRHDRSRSVLHEVRRDPPFGVPEVDRAILNLRRNLRRAAGALFRDDLDDAVRRFRSIDGRCRGTLDDLDAFDVFRVDVVQAAGDGGVLAAKAALRPGRPRWRCSPARRRCR